MMYIINLSILVQNDEINIQAYTAHVSILVYNNSFFMWILYVSIFRLSHERGIRPFKAEKRFGSIFNPTLCLFLFEIKKFVCLVVKIWSKLRLIQSSDGLVVLYSLCSWIAILYVRNASGFALLFILWIFSKDIQIWSQSVIFANDLCQPSVHSKYLQTEI